MEKRIATLTTNQNCYSVFQAGDLRIKFYTSPNLRRYSKVNRWTDNGYIEYTGIFSTSPEPIEDSIDLAFMAERLHLPKDVFKGITEVRLV
jgi:hypothetical protein